MKIDKITQTPFGTIVSLDQNVPSEGVVGSFLTVNGETLHKVKGTPTNVWTEILVDKTDKLQEGQEVKFMKIA